MRYFLKTSYLLILSLFSINAYSQDWVTVEDLINRAQQAKRGENSLESLRLYLTALQRTQNTSDTLAHIHEQIGSIYQGANLHEKALEYFNQIEAPYSEGEAVRMQIAASAYALEKYEEAENAYTNILTNYSDTNPEKALKILEKLNIVAHSEEDYGKALEIQRQMLEISRGLGDSSNVAIVYNNLGYDLKFLEEYEQSKQYFLLALNRNESLNFPLSEQAITHTNIGIVNQNQGNYEEALTDLLKAESILEKLDEPAKLAYTYEIISSVYFNAEDYYNARIYADRAKSIAIAENLPKTRMEVYELSSLIYQQQDEFEQALEEYKQFLSLKDSLNLAERIQQELLLQQQKELERSEEQTKLLLADQEVQELEAKRQKLENEKQAKELEILKQNQALQQSELERQQLQKKQAQQQLLLIRRQLEAEKQENELKALKQREEIQKAELTAQKAREEKQKQELALLEERNRNIEKDKQIQDLALQNIKEEQKFLTGIAILGALITLLIIFGFWNSRKKNKLLAVKNAEIEETNNELNQLNEEMAQQQNALTISNNQLSKAYKQIRDSVKYAKRIQSSILEPIEKIEPHVEDVFILFKPRDLVSGDFYWFSDANPNKIVITAADCTGHGVPGAFMSLIGNDSLDAIVNTKGVTQPNEILNQLSFSIRKTLKQEQTEIRDGMDMALCTIDKKEAVVTFSGAKNPLIVIQAGELTTIKGDRMPIGGSKVYGNKDYTAHSISLSPNKDNYLYLFSDGFQDQFGGELDRKFTIKRFRNLLHSIYQKPMHEQQEILEKKLKEWIEVGKTRQIDDILVIGIRL